VIVSFGDTRTEDLYNGLTNARTKQLGPDVVKAALRKLDMMNAAHRLDDLRIPPANRLEALKGKLAGYHSIRINSQWRIIFRWTSTGPEHVQLVDYH
jgi:proteic killer suppression protein